MNNKDRKIKVIKQWMSQYLYTVITFTVGILVTLIVILALIILIVNRFGG